MRGSTDPVIEHPIFFIQQSQGTTMLFCYDGDAKGGIVC